MQIKCSWRWYISCYASRDTYTTSRSLTRFWWNDLKQYGRRIQHNSHNETEHQHHDGTAAAYFSTTTQQQQHSRAEHHEHHRLRRKPRLDGVRPQQPNPSPCGCISLFVPHSNLNDKHRTSHRTWSSHFHSFTVQSLRKYENFRKIFTGFLHQLISPILSSPVNFWSVQPARKLRHFFSSLARATIG